jgi:hypothetical protein
MGPSPGFGCWDEGRASEERYACFLDSEALLEVVQHPPRRVERERVMNQQR